MVSVNVGSTGGLNTDRIISKLVRVKKRPIHGLKGDKKDIKKEISKMGKIKSAVESLASEMDGLDTTNEVRALSATSSDESVVTTSASGGASPGNYDISVNQLATNEKDISNGFASGTSEVTSGTLSLTVDKGSSEEQNFSVTVNSGDTVQDVKSKINNSDAGDHVSASIIDDGNDVHLTLQRRDTGHALDTTASNALALSHSNSGSSGTDLSFTEQSAGKNAKFSIDGTSVERQQNKVSDALQDVTFNLQSTGNADVEIAIDNSKILEKMEGFVDAFNKAAKKLKKDSDLTGSARRRAMTQLRDTVAGKIEGTSGEFVNLSSIGIGTNYETGMLELDKSDAKDAINQDPTAVANIFAKDDTGIAAKMKEAAQSMTDKNGGLFPTAESSLESRKERIQGRIDQKRERVQQYKERLEEKFINLKETRTEMQNSFSKLL